MVKKGRKSKFEEKRCYYYCYFHNSFACTSCKSVLTTYGEKNGTFYCLNCMPTEQATPDVADLLALLNLRETNTTRIRAALSLAKSANGNGKKKKKNHQI